MHCLIPNIRVLESHLNNFCRICDADEVVLFERTTFLVIATAATILHQDHHRFEKISNIIKQFNLGCSRSQTRFKSMEIRGSNFTAFIDVLTNNTYVMIVMSDPNIRKPKLLLSSLSLLIILYRISSHSIKHCSS